jgi:catabolite regulation protein CreA
MSSCATCRIAEIAGISQPLLGLTEDRSHALVMCGKRGDIISQGDRWRRTRDVTALLQVIKQQKYLDQTE